MPINHLPRFAISKKPYAIDPASFKVTQGGHALDSTPIWRMLVQAVWFRRTSGVLGAHTGHLWDVEKSLTSPTLEDFIRHYSTARHGATPVARWDGDSLWTRDKMSRQEEDALIALLDPALKNFPNIPQGYAGWFVLSER